MSNLEQFQSFAAKDTKIKVSGNNTVIYTRVSHFSQEDNTSLESQKKYCDQFAEKKGLNVVGYFGGTYESAKTDDRKEFKRMLKFIKQSRNISHVIVYSYERFSRSGVGGAKIADDLLADYGVVTLAVTQELDPTTSAGSFQQKILFLFGQMDNEMRRDKTITGMSELLRKGYTPHCPPKGFTNLNKGRAIDQKIVVNETGNLIRKAFIWKAKKGLSNMNIVRKLKELGLKIDKRRLGEIFANPYYCGLIVNGMIPNEVVEGKHEQLISRSIFLKANNIIAEKRSHPISHKGQDENLPLKIFMRCGSCDTPMTGYLVKPKGLYYYKCRITGCKHSQSAKKVHKNFAELLSLFKVEESDIPLIKKTVEAYFDAFFEEEMENTKLITKQATVLKKQIEEIEERHALGKIDVDVYSKFRNKYIDQLKEIEVKNENTLVESSNLEKCINYAIELCSKPSAAWEYGDVEKKKRLQKIIFPDGITISKQNKGVLTSRLNSFFVPIAMVVKALGKIKNGQSISFDKLSVLVSQKGFEPLTASLEGRCSIQLSYWPILRSNPSFGCAKIEKSY